MIQTLDLRGRLPAAHLLADAIPRAHVDVDTAMPVAAELIRDVRERGEQALAEQAERFDGVRPDPIRVPSTAIEGAVHALEPEVRGALEETIDRVTRVSAAQVPPPATTTLGPGAVVEQRWLPVDRAGLYVPGGKAVYPSSVVMNVVPAQVAGVGSIALTSPPQRAFAGNVNPVILGAAGLLGVDEIYAIGGAGAIGALAWGVPSLGLRPVQVVSGPGNAYVAAAKRCVLGRVGIDAEAGTTEILVLADDAADAELIAADLVSQAEHDEHAAAILVTWSVSCADRVRLALVVRAERTANAARVATALSGPQSAIVLVDDAEAGVALTNAYAPEHLEVMTADPDALITRLTNAGAVFAGPSSPVSLGDYLAGSNHILPTGGAARFTSGLAAVTFLRPQQVIRYDHDALAAVSDRIVALADAEGLPAHGEAVRARFPPVGPVG